VIEAQHTLTIDAPIERVWDYVQDIRRWANLMPGMRECTVIDANDSRWLLKVGVGGLVRTVNVLVHVDEWAGPERVNFSYSLEGDPVVGRGSYSAARTSDDQTDVTLHVVVEGSGPVAPMWEAMCRPLLPRLAKSFAEQLKSEIETAATASEKTPPAEHQKKQSVLSSMGRWLRVGGNRSAQE
jgi:carbon monoxide dehydrogenase subunit G